MNVAIVGATGVVGRKIAEVLKERGFFADNYYLFASQKSDGVKLEVLGDRFTVEALSEDSLFSKKIHLAFFCAGTEVSRRYAPRLAQTGTYVIDNSSAFRLYKEIPLVVPEVNDYSLFNGSRLISNPNCSTIMLMPILHSLKKFGLKRVVVTTYQAVSGAGMRGITDLKNGEKGLPPKKFERAIYSDCIPKIGDFNGELYSEEEMKIINESRKILDNENLKITATAVRVPVYNCHAEAVNVELGESFEFEDILNALSSVSYVKVFKDFPTAKDANDTDNVLVGRIRRDYSKENAILLWAVSDNLRVGAATNAVRIAETLQKSSRFGINMPLTYL